MGDDGDTLSKPTVYMKLYVNDLTRDTMELSPEEYGVYMRLLVAMWVNGGWLEFNEKRLARTCGTTTRRFVRIWTSIANRYFTVLPEGRFTQKRLSREYQLALSRSESAQLNGRSGGLKSAELKETGGSKRSSEIQANGQASHKSVVSSHESEIRDPETDMPVSTSRVAYSDEFEQACWQRYPHQRRVNKKAAYAAWTREKPEVAMFVAGLEAWKRHPDWMKEDGKYIPYPERFIKNRRWEDDAVTNQASGNSAQDRKYFVPPPKDFRA